MFADLNTQTRQLVTGNLLLIGCCAFYLAWWLIAFHPTHSINGLKSGWLLIPAFILGCFAVVRILGGCRAEEGAKTLLPNLWILIGAVVIYLVLLAFTTLVFHRMVTSELILITGWAALVFAEVNTLYGLGAAGFSLAAALMVVTAAAAVVSLICYVLYYGLDRMKGYVDGMIPLILAAVMMAVLTVVALRN